MSSLYQTAQEPRQLPVPGFVVRYLDVLLVVVAAIPALVLGAPALGYVIGAAGWIVQRVIQVNEHRLTADIADPRTAVGARLFGSFGRVWLLAAAIVIAGLTGHRADGLTAALVIFCAYSVAFVVRLLSGPPPSRVPR
jgi:hypothetical protein